MDIRFADVSDIPGLLALLHQVGQVHHEIRPDLFRSGAVKYTPRELEEILKEDSTPIFVAVETTGQVLGYCFCQLRRFRGSTVMTDRQELYIDDLCVDENCRGQHIGKVLYDHACAFARKAGCSHITLNVWCGNESALAFYEKRGLKPRSITMDMALEEHYAD